MKTVSIVRDPVAVNVSSFFQTLDWTHPSLASRLRGAPHDPEMIDEVLAALRDDAWMGNPLDWFQLELADVLGVPVFDNPFPTEIGYQILQGQQCECLILKYEDIGRVFSDAMRDFFDLPDCTLERRNSSDSKYYSTAYTTAMQVYRPTKAQVDRLYGSRAARHFYTSEEISAFRAKWLRRGVVGQTE